MGRIRSALRAYALESVDPADVLTRLDRKIQRFEPDAMATAHYAVISPERDRFVISSAGHLPPLLITVSGARIVDIPPDLPLGAYRDAPRRNTTVDLPVEASLLLYTDGLIERRDEPISDAVTRLSAAVAGATPEDVCGRATALLAHDMATDDVAILAVQRIFP
jgi:sigma-B regulation protein RsbU (phosphoserine phosphatase)